MSHGTSNILGSEKKEAGYWIEAKEVWNDQAIVEVGAICWSKDIHLWEKRVIGSQKRI